MAVVSNLQATSEILQKPLPASLLTGKRDGSRPCCHAGENERPCRRPFHARWETHAVRLHEELTTDTWRPGPYTYFDISSEDSDPTLGTD